MCLEKIISGGQTGIDQMALEVALELNIPTGGTAAKGFMTETGPDLTLADYGLREHTVEGYPPRTKQNVLDADGTILYGDITSVGTRLTKQYCIQLSRPYVENPSPEELSQFIVDNQVRTLNVAGNRGSKMTAGQQALYRNLFKLSIEMHLKNAILKNKSFKHTRQ